MTAGSPVNQGPGNHGAYILLSDVMVTMRDGVRLATDIYLPAGEAAVQPGKFPVILERTPYGKTVASRSERSAADPVPMGRAEVAAFFTTRAYVFVYQDCRGTFGSEGRFTKYLSEGEDGFDTIAWIARQSWCNGKVGTMGLSYAAHTQVAAACLAPPALAAMFVDSGGFYDAYQGGIRQGGAFELKQATWALRQALQSPEAKSDAATRTALESEMKDISGWFRRLPWRKGSSPLRWLPEFEDYLFEQWTHGVYDGFWKKLGICSRAFMDRFADIPAVFMSSWYDPYPRTATGNYTDLKARGKGPVSLILGPWTHGDRNLSHSGDVDFGPRATLEHNLADTYLELRARFFDRWLKDVPDESDTAPPVRYFRMGGGSGRRNSAGRLDHGGTWLGAADWPLPEMRLESLYLRKDGALDPAEPGDSNSSVTFRYDPENPVPSIGGTITSGEPVMRGGAFNQTGDGRFFGCQPPFEPLSRRPDVLVFETPVLEEALEVTGPVAVDLWVSSDCPDTDFTMKLIDVYPASASYPEGFAMNLTDGILRLRYRDSWEKPALMEPGEICRIRIDAFPTSNLFGKGHRIRLDISSSNFPHFDANPNTGEPEGESTRAAIASNTVHMGIRNPSCLILPVVRREDTAALRE